MKEKEEIQKKQHQIEKLAEEQTKFERNAKLFDAQKKNMEQKIEEKEGTIDKYGEDKKENEKTIEDLRNQNKKIQDQLDAKKKEYIFKCRDFETLKNQHDNILRDCESLRIKIDNLEVEIGEFRNKNRELEKMNKVYNRVNNGLVTDKERITNEKKEAEYEKNLTKNGVNALTREIEHLRRDTEQDKKKIIDLIRFRDMMSKSIKKAEDENMKNKDEISSKVNEIAKLKE